MCESLYFCSTKVFKYCGVMKFLADMPSCLGGGDPRINVI
jgi:hypothetical protein